MKSVKCPQCGFVGWADAERCKKCGVEQLPDPTDDAYQPPANYRNSQSPYRDYSDQELKKGLAVFSLVVGILNFFTLAFLGIGSIVGITAASVALSRAKRNPQVYGGRELAIAGLVTNLVSVGIIVPVGIIAAIAIPNLLASRRAANEGASISTLRKLHEAEATYQATSGNGDYGTLDELAANRLISPELATGARYGYKFTVNVKAAGYDEPPRFQVVGVPLTYGSSGLRSFYIDETGVIRGENSRGADATELSPPLNTDGYSSSSPPSRRYSED